MLQNRTFFVCQKKGGRKNEVVHITVKGWDNCLEMKTSLLHATRTYGRALLCFCPTSKPEKLSDLLMEMQPVGLVDCCAGHMKELSYILI